MGRMRGTGQSTPVTEMLGLYRRLSAIRSKNLTAHLELAMEFAERPEEISARFVPSKTEARRWRGWTQRVA